MLWDTKEKANNIEISVFFLFLCFAAIAFRTVIDCYWFNDG